MKTDRIKAGKHFQIESLSRLAHAALHLAMAENAAMPADTEKIGKLCQRFKVGKPFAFYSQRPELFW